MKAITLMRGIADMVMPRHCTCCGRTLLLFEESLCTCCRADLPETRFWKSALNPMSEAFNALIQRCIDEADGAAAYQPPALAAALFYYRGGYRNLTRSLKYHRDFGAGRCAARLLGRRLAGSPLFADVDLVVPVPLHWRRLWSRGYNQAEVIAGEVAAALEVPMYRKLLVRRKRTRSQTGFDREGRLRNVRGSFAVRHGRRAAGVLARACHILLVDDVYTTGATLAACERALREAAPAKRPDRWGENRILRISAATLAYVGY